MQWQDWPRTRTASDLDCIEAGSGAPVALIHGVGLRADAWGAQIPALAEHYHVRAFDTPGRGGSAPVGDAPALADYTDRFAEAIAAFSEPALVAGHSMGALIVLDLGIRYPHLVRGVAALNGVFRRSNEARKAVQARAASLAAGNQADLSATLPRWFGEAPQGGMQNAMEACRRWLLSAEHEGYAKAYTVFAQADGPATDDLSAMQCQALIMTGALEANSTPAMSREMARIAPNATCYVMAGANHMLPMTHPDETNRVLLDFFRKC